MSASGSTTARGRWAWAFYDWANSTFATTVMAGFFPLFFQHYWSKGVPGPAITLHLGVGNAVASGVIFVLAPVLGAMSDDGRKKPFLLGFMLLGCVCTTWLCLVGEGNWQSAILLFVLASIGFFGANVFYDALLKEVCEPASYDRVSALGYALGYLGGGLLFAVNVLMAVRPHMFGLPDRVAAVRVSFVMVGFWWFVFSLPLAFRVREAAAKSVGSMTRGLAQLRATAMRISELRPVVLFLIAYWLYIDGVGTIVRMAVNYGLSLGFDPNSLILALLITQFVGFPAALVFGRLGERMGVRKTLLSAIFVYMGVTVWAYFLRNAVEFYLLAGAVGLVQGGLQALSRSFYARLIPAGESGEFFGFYNMLGKFAAVLGPLLVGMTAMLTGSQRLAILSIIVLFTAGGALLWFVEDPASAAPGRVGNTRVRAKY